MRRKLLSIFFVLIAIFNLCNVALADDSEIVPYSSDYLNGATVFLRAVGNGRMAVDITVDAVGVADTVGVREIYIEHLVNGRWKYYDSMDSVDHPEFYDYNSRDYLATIYFDGISGDTYRVTLQVYAKKGSGSDTHDLTSRAVSCK